MSDLQRNGGNMTTDNNTSRGRPSGIPLDTIPALVFMVFIIVINSGVILLISSYSRLRTTSNIILASLAVSDFLVGFIGIPLLVTCSSIYMTSICLSTNIFFIFMAQSTVLHLTVMTCDRYIYIMWALRYRDIVRRSRVLTVLGLTWFISLSCSLVRLTWIWNISIQSISEDLALVEKKDKILFTFNMIAFFFIPLIVMIVLDAHMLLLVRKQCQRIARENLPMEFMKREKKLQKRQRRAVLTCVLLLILYVIFWLPNFTLEFLQQNHYGQIPFQVITFIYYLRMCTSLFNPLAYTLRKQDLKRKAKSITYNLFPWLRPDPTENRTEQYPLSSRSDL
ncbi:hypothetical protein OS493_029393 [Desmophyllum pertusum]|uniref:G-protein coupled receptors family 1 profile domain-containing protein n=1 Tax=Desmophyllum pertusum TaxID=174260 RepID=A0A9W9YY29_9CNID|nr:hypothetical protein OS493_029393 [Desmophyllum pertusum]